MYDINAFVATCTQRTTIHEDYSLPHAVHQALELPDIKRIGIWRPRHTPNLSEHFIELMRIKYAKAGKYLRVINIYSVTSQFLDYQNHKPDTLWVLEVFSDPATITAVLDFAKAHDIMVLVCFEQTAKYQTFNEEVIAEVEFPQLQMTLVGSDDDYRKMPSITTGVANEVYVDTTVEVYVEGHEELSGEKSARSYIETITDFIPPSPYAPRQSSNALSHLLKKMNVGLNTEIDTKNMAMIEAGLSGNRPRAKPHVDVNDLSDMLAFIMVVAPELVHSALATMRDVALYGEDISVSIYYRKGAIKVTIDKDSPTIYDNYSSDAVLNVRRVGELFYLQLCKMRLDLNGIFVGRTYACELNIL